MSPDDRELLHILRRQQQELQRSLAHLEARLGELEARLEQAPPEIHHEPPPLPPLPSPEPEPTPAELPHDLPVVPGLLPPLPPPPLEETLPPLPPVPQPSLEFRLARWLPRIGAVMFVLLIVFVGIYTNSEFHIIERMGAWGKLSLMGLVSVGLVAGGQRMARRNPNLLIYGRTVMAAGLGGLYFTFYAAHFIEPLRVIQSPTLGVFLLLGWSAYVFGLAERKKSQLLSLFAITLAYVSTAITPVGTFTMAANLILAATAVLFLLRNGWAALSYISLFGTYLALARRLVVDENGGIVFYSSHYIHFWPHALYLCGAWLIFTAAVLLSTSPAFTGPKRLIFLSLNNGAWAGLLALTAHISGYNYDAIGRTFLFSGLVLLGTSLLAGVGRSKPDARDMVGAYLAQGLGLFTAGLCAVYTGLSRGVLLAVETLILGCGGAYSRNLILKIGAAIVAALTTLFLFWEIGFNAHSPWILGIGGAFVMRLNAWWARRDIRHTPQSRETIVIASAYYCVLALGLVFIAMATELSDNVLPPALAFVAVGVTFFIYLVPLYESPPTVQIFLLAAQAIVLFPADNGQPLPWWSTAGVALATLIMITWWSRQTVTRTGSWTLVLNLLYALALVGLTYQAIRPHVDTQTWMLDASLLSIAFLVYGVLTRTWPIAIVSQAFLVLALYHFFIPAGIDGVSDRNWADFPWAWWAALVPITVVYVISRAVHTWLDLFPEITDSLRSNLRVMAYNYQILTLAMVIRYVDAVVPYSYRVAAYLFLGTLVLAWNVRQASAFGVRCSFALSGIGMLIFLSHFGIETRELSTWLNALALLALLAQPAFLRHAGRELVSKTETWALILFASLLGWFFVSGWVATRLQINYLTIGWALYAVFLFLLGLAVQERRLRWCGLVILLAAIVRVFAYDFWGFSNGYRVLTFFALTVITLGLGFIYARFAERLKTWL